MYIIFLIFIVLAFVMYHQKEYCLFSLVSAVDINLIWTFNLPRIKQEVEMHYKIFINKIYVFTREGGEEIMSVIIFSSYPSESSPVRCRQENYFKSLP